MCYDAAVLTGRRAFGCSVRGEARSTPHRQCARRQQRHRVRRLLSFCRVAVIVADDARSMVSADDARSMVSADDARSMVSADDARSMVCADDARSMVSADGARTIIHAQR